MWSPSLGKLARSKILEECEKYHVTFHGRPIGDNGIKALLAVAPYVNNVKVTAALKLFEDVSKKLNDQTMLSKLMMITTNYFTKSTDSAADIFAEMVECLRNSLIFKDIAEEKHINQQFLIGAKNKAGFAQSFFKRKSFLDFLSALIIASGDNDVANEAKERILPYLNTCGAVVDRFTEPPSAAAGGSMALATLGVDEDAEEENASAKKSKDLSNAVPGLSNVGGAAFDEFQRTLSPTGKEFATLLWKINTCQFDNEFEAIARAEMINPTSAFPWEQLLKPSEDHAVNDNKIHGISLPLLIKACSNWVEVKNNASAKTLGSSAVGDEDRIVETAMHNARSDSVPELNSRVNEAEEKNARKPSQT